MEQALNNPKMLGRYDALFYLYGPLEGSLWEPYQCPTLFASIDKLSLTPREVELSEGFHQAPREEAWQWVRPDTLVLLDLPDGATIEVGSILMRQGAQFISTFDHWPMSQSNVSARPVIDSIELINKMYTLAPKVRQLRQTLSPDAAPIWLCDSRRLGTSGRSPSPGTFDNRYYIDDSILPGVKTLKKGGIRRIVHFNEKLSSEPLPDLVPFILDAHNAGIALEKVSLDEESTWVRPQIMKPPFKRRLPIRGFRRSDMGGFGQMVPVPSEGSYGSGGGGG